MLAAESGIKFLLWAVASPGAVQLFWSLVAPKFFFSFFKKHISHHSSGLSSKLYSLYCK